MIGKRPKELQAIIKKKSILIGQLKKNRISKFTIPEAWTREDMAHFYKEESP